MKLRIPWRIPNWNTRAKADPDALRRAVASAVARAWTATHALLAIPLERKVTSTPEALRAERDELLDVTIPNALEASAGR